MIIRPRFSIVRHIHWVRDDPDINQMPFVVICDRDCNKVTWIEDLPWFQRASDAGPSPVQVSGRWPDWKGTEKVDVGVRHVVSLWTARLCCVVCVSSC